MEETARLTESIKELLGWNLIRRVPMGTVVRAQSGQIAAKHDGVWIDGANNIVNRITANLAEPISMSDVAAELGMSESRFSRFFRRSTGNSFTDFVNRVRINSACHLLMQTDHYVTDICYQVGFNNVANFNRRFLEIKGMTPSEFRRQADTRFG